MSDLSDSPDFLSPMNYRSISSHRGMPDPQVIELAARLGFNDVCFQVEGEQSLMLRELRERWDRSGTPGQMKSLGMTISLWVHEFEDLDPSWGDPVFENDMLWENLRKRYLKLLTEDLPEVNWLVLTVVESTVRVTDPRMLEKLCLLLRDVCKACDKKLMIRSFVWTLEEFDGVRKAIEGLPDDITVMTKYVPQDWHRGSYDDGTPFHDPLIGNIGAKQQIVELDIAGEYFRGDHAAQESSDTQTRADHRSVPGSSRMQPRPEGHSNVRPRAGDRPAPAQWHWSSRHQPNG
jgi:hypothetical protein